MPTLDGGIQQSGAGGSSDFSSAPGYLLASGSLTANQTISVTSEATAADVITASSATYDGSTVAVTLSISNLNATAAAAIDLLLQEGGTVLGYFGGVRFDGAGGGRASFHRTVYITPNAGAHTYKVTAFRATANVAIQAGAGGAGANFPATLRITRT